MNRLAWSILWGTVAIALLLAAVWLAYTRRHGFMVVALLVGIGTARQSYRSFKAPIE